MGLGDAIRIAIHDYAGDGTRSLGCDYVQLSLLLAHKRHADDVRMVSSWQAEWSAAWAPCEFLHARWRDGSLTCNRAELVFIDVVGESIAFVQSDDHNDECRLQC